MQRRIQASPFIIFLRSCYAVSVSIMTPLRILMPRLQPLLLMLLMLIISGLIIIGVGGVVCIRLTQNRISSTVGYRVCSK
jgi:hypothetical protein